MRISQFFVLPPFQGKGHGGVIYRYMYGMYMANASVKEITVEDPNDEFQMLRDKNDVQNLLLNNAFKNVKAPLSKLFLKSITDKFKLCKVFFIDIEASR